MIRTPPAAATPGAQPRPMLTLAESLAMVVGHVIGVGIFKAPSIVAGNSAGEPMFFALWIAGGIASLIGALCYAELGSAYPNAGGEYFFLRRAYGNSTALLFAWARMSMIQTGVIAGREIEDSCIGIQLTYAFERIAQCETEFAAAGLGHLQRLRYCLFQL